MNALVDNEQPDVVTQQFFRSPQGATAKKRKIVVADADFVDRFLKIEEQKLKIFKEEKLRGFREEDDENLLFFKSLVPYMRMLSPVQQLIARNKIQEVLVSEISKTNDGIEPTSLV